MSSHGSPDPQLEFEISQALIIDQLNHEILELKAINEELRESVGQVFSRVGQMIEQMDELKGKVGKLEATQATHAGNGQVIQHGAAEVLEKTRSYKDSASGGQASGCDGHGGQA